MPRTVDEDAIRVGVKTEIRARRRAMRRALPADARERRSDSITERVLSLDEWRDAAMILTFVSKRTEVQTGRLVEHAWRAGKRVATTRVTPEGDELTLHLWASGDELEDSGLRFRQPLASAERVAEESVDLVLVPALAVDERGHRIGYGRGFYDRLLPRLTNALRVALVFDFERIAEVPARDGDEPVDVIVTDERVVRTAAR